MQNRIINRLVAMIMAVVFFITISPTIFRWLFFRWLT